jgi:hypothetical protein
VRAGTRRSGIWSRASEPGKHRAAAESASGTDAEHTAPTADEIAAARMAVRLASAELEKAEREPGPGDDWEEWVDSTTQALDEAILAAAALIGPPVAGGASPELARER